MAARRNSDPEPRAPRRPPSPTPEGRENQLISLAVDLAEQQLRDGTASAQVVTHYLKLGSSREKLEQQKIAMETELIGIKRQTIEVQQQMVGLVEEALNAMRAYSGSSIVDRPLDD